MTCAESPDGAYWLDLGTHIQGATWAGRQFGGVTVNGQPVDFAGTTITFDVANRRTPDDLELRLSSADGEISLQAGAFVLLPRIIDLPQGEYRWLIKIVFPVGHAIYPAGATKVWFLGAWEILRGSPNE